jgi:hypothetical protein
MILTDGTSYIVEINMNGSYRTYVYMNPEYQEWPDARHMLKDSLNGLIKTR